MRRVLALVRAAGWRGAALAAAALALLLAPGWGPRVLAHLSFFRLRRVEVDGVRYLPARDVLARLAVDTTNSVWDDVGPAERRLEAHPQILSATIDRDMPGTWVVHVEENRPVALVSTAAGLRAADESGRLLPIDPTRVAVDLPLLARPDTQLLRLLGDVRERNPGLFQRISDVRRTGSAAGEELVFDIASVVVRATPDLSARRLADIIPVESDLARRKARATELDLRFRDQVIARLQ